jgi:hypothetical protein
MESLCIQYLTITMNILILDINNDISGKNVTDIARRSGVRVPDSARTPSHYYYLLADFENDTVSNPMSTVGGSCPDVDLTSRLPELSDFF